MIYVFICSNIRSLKSFPPPLSLSLCVCPSFRYIDICTLFYVIIHMCKGTGLKLLDDTTCLLPPSTTLFLYITLSHKMSDNQWLIVNISTSYLLVMSSSHSLEKYFIFNLQRSFSSAHNCKLVSSILNNGCHSGYG